jgi:hypothetical protein
LKYRKPAHTVIAVTAARFRRIALGLEGVEERAHMGHPDFRVGGRIFATLSADGRKGMVKLTPNQQAARLATAAGTFEPASGAWGRQGCTMVILASADEETVGEAMTDAWRQASAPPSRPAGSRSPTPRRRRPASTRGRTNRPR